MKLSETVRWLHTEISTAIDTETKKAYPGFAMTPTQPEDVSIDIGVLQPTTDHTRNGSRFTRVTIPFTLTLSAPNELKLLSMCDAMLDWLKTSTRLVDLVYKESVNISFVSAERDRPQDEETHAFLFNIELEKNA